MNSTTCIVVFAVLLYIERTRWCTHTFIIRGCGQAIGGWRPSPNHPGGEVMVADVADFPLPEIKMLRLGGRALRRSRWPKLVGDGLTTPNFAFAMPWSAQSCAVKSFACDPV